MRKFVIQIAEYARQYNPDFIVIPQNGQCVAWHRDYDENPLCKENRLDREYFNAINGTGREDMFYGAGDTDYTRTPEEYSGLFQSWCDVYKNQTGADGKKITVLSIDYCKPEDFKNSNTLNENKGYISFATSERNLNTISTSVFNENSEDVSLLSDAKNFLFFLNYENFQSKENLLSALENTNYDLIIMDAYSNDGSPFSKSEIESLKTKKNGGKRLVICYISIGEAETYRWYFNKNWLTRRKPNLSAPSWLDKENPEWEGNYKVRYWKKSWQKIICNNEDSYTKRILDAGFDGVYLDIIDAYEYYE